MESPLVPFENAFANAHIGLWISDKSGRIIYVNKTLASATQMNGRALLGSGWEEAIVREDRNRVSNTFNVAFSSRTHFDVMFRIKNGSSKNFWCRATGDSYYDKQKQFAGFSGLCLNISELVDITNQFSTGENRFRSLIEQAPMAIGLLRGRDMIVEIGNDRILEVWGRDRTCIGKRILDVLPEIKEQGFVPLMERVYFTGKPFVGSSLLAKLVRNGHMSDVYFDFVYSPVRNDDGIINGIMIMATEVTKDVIARRAVAEYQSKYRSLN